MFGVDLIDVLHTRSWKWFWARLRYLMSDSGSALHRRFAPPPEPPPPEVPTFDL